MFAYKKDASLYFCVDYCRLSAVTIYDSYSLLCLDEFMDSLGEATKFLFYCMLTIGTGRLQLTSDFKTKLDLHPITAFIRLRGYQSDAKTPWQPFRE